MDTKNAFERLFILNYIGQFDNGCFGNATKSYLAAKGLDSEALSKSKKDKNGNFLYSKEYNTARTEGSSLLNKAHIQKLKEKILSEKFTNIESIKIRHYQLAMQNKDLAVARQANSDIMKIYGLLGKNKTKLDSKELEILTSKIKNLLTR